MHRWKCELPCGRCADAVSGTTMAFRSHTRPTVNERLWLHSLGIVCLIGLVGCSQSKPVEERPGPGAVKTVTENAQGVRVVQYDELSREGTLAIVEEPLLVIGDAGRADDVLLVRLGDVHLLDDGRVVVVERQAEEILVFGPDGALQTRFGGEGQGPGEFQAVLRTEVGTENRFFVWDQIAQRLTTFTLEGEVLESVRTGRLSGMRFFVQDLFPDGGLLLSKYEPLEQGAGQGVVRLAETMMRWSAQRPDDLEGLAERTIARSYRDSAGVTRSLPLVADPIPGYAATREGIYLIDGVEFEYDRLDLAGAHEQVVRVAEEAEAISEEFFEAYKEDRLAEAPASVQPRLRLFYQEMPVPEFLPMVDQIFVDGAQRVWIRRYRVTRQEEQVFHVFEQDGSVVGTVRLPAQLEFRTATEDRLVGVWRDELDEPTVRIWALGATTAQQ